MFQYYEGFISGAGFPLDPGGYSLRCERAGHLADMVLPDASHEARKLKSPSIKSRGCVCIGVYYPDPAGSIGIENPTLPLCFECKDLFFNYVLQKNFSD